jgi:hypothetical protein
MKVASPAPVKVESPVPVKAESCTAMEAASHPLRGSGRLPRRPPLPRWDLCDKS